MKSVIEISKEFILKIYKKPQSSAHKGTLGHALITGGSYGKMGSVCLSAKAAIKSGCGLVTAFIPKCGYEIVQISIPEVMVLTDPNENLISNISFDFLPDAIGIGVGMGKDAETQNAFYTFLKSCKKPMVIDADALNILSENKDWLILIPENSILTPHPKELQRLIGTWSSDDEKFSKTANFSKKYNCIIVMKGAPTNVIFEDSIYQNSTGNQALATAGSGDVLTGILTGLLAQKYEPINAAIVGVYLHGLTADIAVKKTGYQSFTASDIIKYLGKAFLSLDK